MTEKKFLVDSAIPFLICSPLFVIMLKAIFVVFENSTLFEYLFKKVKELKMHKK